jgi:hypothetical protein
MTNLFGTWRDEGGGPSARERTVGARDELVNESVDTPLGGVVTEGVLAAEEEAEYGSRGWRKLECVLELLLDL